MRSSDFCAKGNEFTCLQENAKVSRNKFINNLSRAYIFRDSEIYQQTRRLLFCFARSSRKRINSKRMVIDLSEWKRRVTLGDKAKLVLWENFEFHKKMTSTGPHYLISSSSDIAYCLWWVEEVAAIGSIITKNIRVCQIFASSTV